MIELSQIPASSELKELRGQINAMADEINTGQMVLGRILNPSLEYRDTNDEPVGSVKASDLHSELFALCMPEPDGLFIAYIFGGLYTLATPELTGLPDTCEVAIPAIKIPNRDSAVSTFVTMQHAGLSLPGDDQIGYYQCGILAWDVTAKYTPSGGSAIVVNFTHPVLRVSSSGGASLFSTFE